MFLTPRVLFCTSSNKSNAGARRHDAPEHLSGVKNGVKYIKLSTKITTPTITAVLEDIR